MKWANEGDEKREREGDLVTRMRRVRLGGINRYATLTHERQREREGKKKVPASFQDFNG